MLTVESTMAQLNHNKRLLKMYSAMKRKDGRCIVDLEPIERRIKSLQEHLKMLKTKGKRCNIPT